MFENIESWKTERAGKITASECFKIIQAGKGKQFSQIGYSYLDERVSEILTLLPISTYRENINSIEWGNANEYEAIQRVSKELSIKDNEIEYFGIGNPKFMEIDEYSGASPDALTEKYVVEIKCPANSKEHKIHLLFKSELYLLEYSPKYYWQVKMNMLACKKKEGLFVSYDPRYIYEHLQIKILKISNDGIDKLTDRLEEAKQYIKTEIEQLINLKIKI